MRKNQALVDAWLDFYAAGGGSVAAKTAELTALHGAEGMNSARENALTTHLWGGDLPGCDAGVAPGAFRFSGNHRSGGLTEGKGARRGAR